MRYATSALVAVTTALSLRAFTSVAQPMPDAALDGKIHAYLLAHPEVIEEAMEVLQAKQDLQKASAAQGLIAKNRQAIERDPRDGVVGDPNGAVTLVEFYDYRCPFCKASEPDLKTLLARHPNVRLVLKEFPILDLEDQSHISEDASRAALAAKAQGKYLKVHDDLLAERQLDEDAIQRILRADGVDLSQDQALAKSAAVSAQIADTHKLARALGIDGTPAFVINGALISGARLDEIEAAIASAPAPKTGAL